MTATPREDAVRTAAARRGLVIEPFGKGWRVHGPGVDLLTLNLADLDVKALEPERHDRPGGWVPAFNR